MADISRFDRYLESWRVGIKSNRVWILSLAGGFSLGRFTDVLSEPNVKTISDLYESLFAMADRPFNVLSWLSIAILISVPLTERILDGYCRKKSYEAQLAKLIASKIDPKISPFARGTLAWGSSLSLLVAPDLREGWKLDDIKIRYAGTEFDMPSGQADDYNQYFKEKYEEKRFFDDSEKFMLTQNPIAFSDSPTLLLHLRKTKYSVVQYYWDRVATSTHLRSSLIAEAMEGDIPFPNAFAIHAMIVTRDNRVLLTERSEKVGVFAECWSVSAEEQLARADFEPDNDRALLRCARRLLHEEFGVERGEYDEGKFQALSVFVEGDILNCALATVCRLRLTGEELNNKLAMALQREDNEFSDWEFLSFERLISELDHPSRVLHPTSGYRILLALIKRYGAPWLAENMFRN